jgi:hypothetical protein
VCKLPRGAAATFLLNGTPAGNCTFQDVSFCDTIVEVPQGPIHRLSLVFSARGYSGALIARNDSSDVRGGGAEGDGEDGGGGASTHFIVQSVASDASNCAASDDNLRENSGPGAMWALDGSAWGPLVGDRYILPLRIFLSVLVISLLPFLPRPSPFPTLTYSPATYCLAGSWASGGLRRRIELARRGVRERCGRSSKFVRRHFTCGQVCLYVYVYVYVYVYACLRVCVHNYI